MAVKTPTNPAGVPNVLDAGTVKKYLTGTVDEMVTEQPLTNNLAADPYITREAGAAGTILLNTIKMGKLGKYNKATGFTSSAVTSSWKPYALEYDRGTTFALDSVDINSQDGMLEAGAQLFRFVRQSVIPEIDMVRIARCAENAGGTKAIAAMTKTNIVDEISKAIDAVRDGSKVENGTIVYLNRNLKPALNKLGLAQNSVQITDGSASIRTVIRDIDDAEIRYVPDAYMHTVFTEGDEGLVAGGNTIQALAVAPGCAQGVIGRQYQKIWEAGTYPGIDGAAVEFRLFHDLFVPENAKGGIYSITQTARAQ